MILHNSTVLNLGGWGLVGMAAARKMSLRGPSKMVMHSLHQHEAEESCQKLAKEFPKVQFIPEWGDIFVREGLKDRPRKDVMANRAWRRQFMEDIFERPIPERLQGFYLHKLISKYRPDVIVDSVNSATGLAYQDIYSAYYDVKADLDREQEGIGREDPFFEKFERLLNTVQTPQLIRHIQVLVDATMNAGVHTYVKVGTTGTGGMGLNIPFTHSEDKPSGQLLSKSLMAGAHSMLLFLMGRTPGCPYVKEIKPAAAIAWKGIGYGEIHRGGKPIPLFDCTLDQAEVLDKTFMRQKDKMGTPLKENLKAVYIDTGENGIFSADEFFTITAAEQMEFVTPEEIAQAVLWEIEGGNSGFDVIGALDSVVMGPSYRAGILRTGALDEMKRLERKTGTDSVAFEMLGPPHLSKLLYEAHLLNKCYANPGDVLEDSPENMSAKVTAVLHDDRQMRATMISIGLAILLSDGKRLLRGPDVKIPAYAGSNMVPIENGSIEEWADKGWVDLRPKNMKKWQQRIGTYLESLNRVGDDTSSGVPWERMNIDDDDGYFPGKIVTHIFIEEEKGARIKS
jgi:hypothetical protein